MKKIYKPAGDYPFFYQPYMDCVPNDGDLVPHLAAIQNETEEPAQGISEEKLYDRYAKDKWTVKDILVHLSDCERVIIYRAMRIARNDKTELPGFDENLFVENAHAINRGVDSMLKELSALRAATLAFIDTLDEEALDRTGTANGYPLSAR